MQGSARTAAWNTLVETVAEAAPPATLQPDADVGRYSGCRKSRHGRNPASPAAFEFDACWAGAGRGSVVLIGGDPGIGKSTLLLQSLAKSAVPRVLYVSGEESRSRSRCAPGVSVSMRAMCTCWLKSISKKSRPSSPETNRGRGDRFDQTLYSGALQSAPGRCAGARMRRATDAACQGQRDDGDFRRPRDKEGALAGPRVLEHMVDTVLYFEAIPFELPPGPRLQEPLWRGERARRVRHDRQGIERREQPFRAVLSQHGGEVAGSCVMVTQEGTRPLLVEIQALVDEAHAPNPRRLSVGLEQNRLALLLAVLHRHAGIACFDQDCSSMRWAA